MSCKLYNIELLLQLAFTRGFVRIISFGKVPHTTQSFMKNFMKNRLVIKEQKGNK